MIFKKGIGPENWIALILFCIDRLEYLYGTARDLLRYENPNSEVSEVPGGCIEDQGKETQPEDRNK